MLGPGETAVVADVDAPVGADRRTVRAAAEFGDGLLAAVRQDAGQPPGLDLDDDDRAVLHPDGAFGEAQAFRDDFIVHFLFSR
ncbi:hypothetical protein D3C78_1862030 [compost metagenome]